MWPGVITSLCLDAVSARMGVWHFLLPAQLPGTLRHLTLSIRTASDVTGLLKTRLFSAH